MSRVQNILVVDGDEDFLAWCRRHLSARGVEIEVETSAERALQRVERSAPDLMIVELRIGPFSGLELLRKLRQQDPNAVVVMTTGFPPSSAVIESMKLGAYDFLRKESLTYDLRPVVEAALSARDEIRAVAAGVNPAPLRSEESRDTIVGKSPAMQEVFKMIGRVSRSDAPVLITGESGCGKEIVARAVHQFSPRSKQEYVAINCAAIPADLLESELFGHEKGSFTGAISQRIGRFEQCDEGTLLLDEIGDMPLTVQSKILRVLQEGEYSRVGGNQVLHSDVRIIAATNKDLEGEVERGHFREDLFYRLNVVRIELPPLRERKEDIPLLVEFFLERIARQRHLGEPLRVSDEAMNLLMAYHWPGNVRELENTLQRACVLATSRVLLPKDLPLGRTSRRIPPGERAADSAPAAGSPPASAAAAGQVQEPGAAAGSVADAASSGSPEPTLERAIQVLLDAAERNSELQLLPFLEREMTRHALERVGGNQVRAARLLGITRGTLRKRIERYEL